MQDGPAGDFVRRRRLHRPLCRADVVQGRRPGPGRRARSARAYFLKPLGGLGQIQFVRADITDSESVARAVEGADAVVNLVGMLKGKFQSVHVDGARNVAEAAAAAGVTALVHVSAIGADPEAQSPMAQQGRRRGKRSAPPFRRDDHPPLDRVRAGGPVHQPLRPDGQRCPSAGDPRRRRFQPVYVPDWPGDRAAALDPARHAGQTYEIGGPQVMTMRELNRWINAATGRNRPVVEIPDAIGRLLATFGGWLPGAPITLDQWRMLERDNVATGPGFDAFGLRPAPLAAVAQGVADALPPPRPFRQGDSRGLARRGAQLRFSPPVLKGGAGTGRIGTP